MKPKASHSKQMEGKPFLFTLLSSNMEPTRGSLCRDDSLQGPLSQVPWLVDIWARVFKATFEKSPIFRGKPFQLQLHSC